MQKKYSLLRIIAWCVAGLIGLVALVILGAILLIGTPYFSAKLGTLLTHKSGRNVVLTGHIETHLWQREPRFIISGVQIGNAEWGSTPTMFQASRIEFSIRPLELLKLRLVLPELIIDQPKLVLEKNEKGDANWNFTENAQAAALKQPVPQQRSEMPVIGHLSISDGELTYRDPAKNILTTLGISTIQGNEGAQDSITIKGKGDYRHQPFLLDVSAASVLQLRESSKPYPFSLKSTVGGTSVDVEGTVQDPIKMEAFNVELDIKGKNAADLFPLTGIALPPTPPYQLRGHLTREGADWKFRQFSGQLGSSDLHGSVIWHPDQKPPYFEGDFVSENLDVADLGGFIGANKKPEDDNRVIPDASLDISRLLAMNADATFRGQHIKSPQLLDDMYMKLSLREGVLNITPISFGIAKGTIAANIKVEGKKTPPVATLDVSFKRLSLGDLFAPLAKQFGKKNVSSGLLGGKANLIGTGKSLRDILATANGTIGIGMEGGALSRLLLELVGLDILRSAGLILTSNDQPVAINCVIGDFVVNDGIMQPRTLIIDTDITTVQGDGKISLKDEAIDLRLHVSPKETSLLSARSPLLITGTFKKPSFGVDPVALAARGGVATALAFLAPPAALLAFIEPGLGEDSHCASYIKQLSHTTGATVPQSNKH